jgi:hypothetical protein
MCRTHGRQEYAHAKRHLHAYQQIIGHCYALTKQYTSQPTLRGFVLTIFQFDVRDILLP